MHLSFTLHETVADMTRDHFLDDSVEVYQTWIMSKLEPLLVDPKHFAGTNGQVVKEARAGYSVRGAPDRGISFRAPTRAKLVLDPQISFDLPDDAERADRRLLFRLMCLWWLSDRGSAKVRATFTDPTLGTLVTALNATSQDAAAARNATGTWVDEHWQGIVRSGRAVSGTGANPWVQVGLQALPGLEGLVSLASQHGDTLIDRHEFIVSTKGTGASIEWFVIPPSGKPSARITGTGFQSFDDLPLADPHDNTRLRGTYVFRIID